MLMVSTLETMHWPGRTNSRSYLSRHPFFGSKLVVVGTRTPSTDRLQLNKEFDLSSRIILESSGEFLAPDLRQYVFFFYSSSFTHSRFLLPGHDTTLH